MASAAALHSLLLPTMARPTHQIFGRRHSSAMNVHRFPCTAVRSSLQEGPQAPQPATPEPLPSSPAPAPAPAPASTETPRDKISTRFSDVLAFSGPAPERINGRLAMVGFVAALAVELAKGDDLASQLSGGRLWWFAGTTALLSLASLVPLFKGVSAQAKSGGLMTSDAELWNGRFAMLGLGVHRVPERRCPCVEMNL